MLEVGVYLCVPESIKCHLPASMAAPAQLPPQAPVPRVGEVIYLSSASAWAVSQVIHEWRSPAQLHIEVWLEYLGGARIAPQAGMLQ